MERIEVSFEITRDLYVEWCKKPVSKNAKQRKFSFCATQIFGIIIALMVFGVSIYSKNVPFIIVGVAFLGLFLYRLFFRTGKVAKKYFRMMRDKQKTPSWIRTFVFENGKIKITDANTTTTLKFNDIQRVEETEDLVYLIQDNDLVYRLPKSAFIKGTPKELTEAFENGKEDQD